MLGQILNLVQDLELEEEQFFLGSIGSYDSGVNSLNDFFTQNGAGTEADND